MENEINFSLRSQPATLLCPKCRKPFAGKLYFLAELDSNGVPICSSEGVPAIAAIVAPTNEKPIFCSECRSDAKHDH